MEKYETSIFQHENKFMNNLLNAKITEKKLVNESDIANFAVSPTKLNHLMLI